MANLAFIAGQYFYHNQRQNLSFVAQSPKNNFSANLLNFISYNIILSSENADFKIDPDEMAEWLEDYGRSYYGKQEFRLNREKTIEFLRGLDEKIRAEPISARFKLENDTITEFLPSENGRVLNTDKSYDNIVDAIANSTPNGQSSVKVSLVVDEIAPEISLSNINDLGINALLGQGESDFIGSSDSRIHNIGVSSKIFNGILLKPGEEFSFNDLLGEVDGTTGYLPELVIKGGQLIPEYGGGICQVSTTVFRSAIAAGLPILERHPHSLPVRYYNPQGFDATIYPGVVDLRFKNDTPSHILLQSKITGSKLSFEIYGSKDGRQVSIDGPYSYDIQPNGALKAILTRTVIYEDGTQKKDEFNSSYKSPSLFPLVRNPLE